MACWQLAGRPSPTRDRRGSLGHQLSVCAAALVSSLGAVTKVRKSVPRPPAGRCRGHFPVVHVSSAGRDGGRCSDCAHPDCALVLGARLAPGTHADDRDVGDGGGAVLGKKASLRV